MDIVVLNEVFGRAAFQQSLGDAVAGCVVGHLALHDADEAIDQGSAGGLGFGANLLFGLAVER